MEISSHFLDSSSAMFCLFGMAINCYTGLMGTGKSYEVVSSIIVPAICTGRRVVSNISGLDNDAIRAYCAEKFDLPLDKLGYVVFAKNSQVLDKGFFPDEAMLTASEWTAFVLPGDLIVIDEAYKIWGTSSKIFKEHSEFFREHRHFVHPVSGVTCDIVLMTQDIGDIHRVLKVVIENSFKCHKAKGVGLDNVYTITMWEGWKQSAKLILKDWTTTYKPEFFPLYKSYHGETQGKETASDSRQNIFNDRNFVVKIVLFVLVLCFILWRLFNFWWTKTHPEVVAKSALPVSSLGAIGPTSAVSPVAGYSPDWRIAGEFIADGKRQIILVSAGHVRLESSLPFIGNGLSQSGMVDGQKVSRFSGSPISTGVPK